MTLLWCCLFSIFSMFVILGNLSIILDLALSGVKGPRTGILYIVSKQGTGESGM